MAALPPRPEDNLPLLGSSNPWDNPPVELLGYLLSRLSVEERIRCRIVCKVWLRIIDRLYPWMKDFSPEKTCIFGCSVDDEITGPRIFVMIKRGDEMIPESIASFPKLRAFRHGNPGKVCTSNGLILLERHDFKSRIVESAVINPLTTEMVLVPGSPYQPVAFDNLTLGYDPLSGSHKLIQVLVWDENNNLGAALYNMRGRSWRFIPFPGWLLAEFENQDQERRGGVCISGTFFWTLHGPTRTIMVCFNLKRENFSRHSMPRGHMERYELANMENRLTLLDLTFGDRIEIWSFVKGHIKEKLWIKSWIIFLNGPIHTTDNVTEVSHLGRDSLLIHGRCSSTGESLFIMQEMRAMFRKCTLKDRSLGLLDVYYHNWNFKSI